MGLILNHEQSILKDKLKEWYTKRDKPYFYYSGRAGTGKTTVVRAFIDEMGFTDSQYLTVAYIGKAVMVLLRKGYSASTIHSLIYDVIVENVVSQVYDEYGEVVNKTKLRMSFELKEHLSEYLKVIICDECKMVPDLMVKQLLSFGIPVIFMGDQHQLAPVMGASTILTKPDFVLNELMRQAEDDPIIMIANWILDDRPIRHGQYGLSSVVETVPFDKSLLSDYDVILCGRNKTRDYINNRIRSEILHMSKNKLYLGEKIICRQNNWEESIDGIFLTNGTVGFVTDINNSRANKKYMTIDFRPDFLDECYEDLKIDRNYFFSPQVERSSYGMSRYNKFEFAYALTTHLAQGSEYDDVLFIDEELMDSDTTRRLRYTAVTRAKRSITFQTPIRSASIFL